MPEDDDPERLLGKHATAQRMIDDGPSHYWGLVRKGKILVVGRGRASRVYLPSVRAYVAELVAQAEAKRANTGTRSDPKLVAQMAVARVGLAAKRSAARVISPQRLVQDEC